MVACERHSRVMLIMHETLAVTAVGEGKGAKWESKKEPKHWIRLSSLV